MKTYEEDLKLKIVQLYSAGKTVLSQVVANIIDRDFKSAVPNKKWLADITEFHIPSGRVYLSPKKIVLMEW